MTRKLLWLIKFLLIITVVVLITLLIGRAYRSWSAPPLQLWHTYYPEELSIQEIDQADWAAYVAHENKIFNDVAENVTDQLPPQARVPSNRYFANSPIHPARFANDWNRSYMLVPEGKPVGAVVFLHGLTDSPYSLRHLAQRYHQSGFVAIGIRLPAHGTVPGALSDVEWEEWMAATRLAVREAKKHTSPDAPLHVIGFSNGGALAMKYALDALEDNKLARPDRLVLVSPMIGITRFARFAGLAAIPAHLPAFSKAAWLSVVPEFNPFKYNSFPVNGATQSHRLTRALQSQISRLSSQNIFNDLPPILTFQSVIDYTVSTAAIVQGLYAHLPDNGSELVLFDVNRATVFNSLMRIASESALNRMQPSLPQRYRLTTIGNIEPHDIQTVARTTEARSINQAMRPLGIEYATHVFSLSHVAIPFPMDDPLYGMKPAPDASSQYGVTLGTLAARGERGALVINMDSLFRTSSNPFYPYMLERIVAGIKDPLPEHPAVADRSKTVIPPPPSSYEQDIKDFMDSVETEEYATP